jgi:hypothetical protein
MCPPVTDLPRGISDDGRAKAVYPSILRQLADSSMNTISSHLSFGIVIVHVARNKPAHHAGPDAAQSSPKLFLARYAPPSVRPEPHLWSGFSSPAIRFVPAEPDGFGHLSARRRLGRFQRTLLPPIEDRRLQAHFLAQVRYRHVLHQMPPQNGDFLLGCVVLPLLLHPFSPLS